MVPREIALVNNQLEGGLLSVLFHLKVSLCAGDRINTTARELKVDGAMAYQNRIAWTGIA